MLVSSEKFRNIKNIRSHRINKYYGCNKWIKFYLMVQLNKKGLKRAYAATFPVMVEVERWIGTIVATRIYVHTYTKKMKIFNIRKLNY